MLIKLETLGAICGLYGRFNMDNNENNLPHLGI